RDRGGEGRRFRHLLRRPPRARHARGGPGRGAANDQPAVVGRGPDRARERPRRTRQHHAHHRGGRRMTIVLIAVAAALVAALLRAPAWLSVGLLVVAAGLTAWAVAVGGVDRALAPLVLTALAIGLIVPSAVQAVRSARDAPPSGKRRADDAQAKAKATPASGFGTDDIPGYALPEKVGSGGMASVYRARRRSDGQVVAVKIPMEQFVADAKFIRRFHREAEVAQRLNHVNIVRTYEHGAIGAQHYMVMEYVDGRSLEGYIEAGELDIELGIDIMKRVVRALQHIHSAGIIHRDIKP